MLDSIAADLLKFFLSVAPNDESYRISMLDVRES